MTEQQRKEFIAARRTAIGRCFPRLNEMQLEGVLNTEGPLLLLAGAGSGKTTVLINRIANIIRFGKGSDCDYVPAEADASDIEYLRNYSGGADKRALELMTVDSVQPWRILAITFTNKAANELKDRLAQMLGEQAIDVWASTFHSACVRILRREITRLGFTSDFTIYDTADSVSLMKMVLKDLGIDEKSFPPRTVLSYISRAKDEQLSAAAYRDAAAVSRDIRKQHIAEAYAEYTKRCIEANALDFDDIIFYTVRILQEYPEALEYYQNRFRYVLVDEYQDTNNLQYTLVSLLSGKWGNICVVGDDDQSIYKFRGATIENILNFEKEFKNARVIRLEQNYRSTKNILDTANSIIRNNVGRKGKELWTKAPPGEKVTLYSAANENDEAQYIASRILEGCACGESLKDFAVLYRMNAQSNQLEFAFKRNGIGYKVIGGHKFFDRAEIKDMLSYLAVISNCTDTLRLMRIVNNPSRGIGDKTLDAITEMAERENRSAYEIMLQSAEIPALSKSSPKILRFTDIIESLKRDAEKLTLEQLYDEMLARTGYLSMLESKNTPENQSRIENIKELKTNIIQYAKANEDATLAGFLDEVALYTDIDQLDSSTELVTMMTMHSAKGLEFKTVFIAGAEEGIFPGIRAIGDNEEIEEERRLCYVAVTRAKRKLYITYAKQRMILGRTSSNLPSRFVEEIPDEYIEKLGDERYNQVLREYNDYHRKYNTNDFGIQKKSYEKPRYTGMNMKGLSMQKPSAVKIDYRKGDTVLHKAFGKGMVIAVTPMGGDAMLEVAFDSVGTKKLMANSASKFMSKKQGGI